MWDLGLDGSVDVVVYNNITIPAPSSGFRPSFPCNGVAYLGIWVLWFCMGGPCVSGVPSFISDLLPGMNVAVIVLIVSVINSN